jgi:diguanylate cyclase (GGDEF)-like protein
MMVGAADPIQARTPLRRGMDRNRVHIDGEPPRWLRALIAAGLEVERGRPFEGDGVVLRIAPFVIAGGLAFAFGPLLPGASSRDVIVGVAIAVALACILLVPWERLPAWTQMLPPLTMFAMVALVRDAEGAPAYLYTYSPVVLLPVFWFALYGTRAQLLISVVAVGVTFAIPSGVVGGDAYPTTEWLAALLWMGLAGIMGFVVNELVRQRELLARRLEHIARTDVLTGLPNRRAWDEALERELGRADRTGAPVCVTLLDLDHFKGFNDLHGHQAGDEHLRDVALEWRARLRTADLIARYGGEEFAVILTDTGLDRARAVIERLRRSVPRGETVSSGTAEWDRSESGAELVARADNALYAAKHAGRDRAMAAVANGS